MTSLSFQLGFEERSPTIRYPAEKEKEGKSFLRNKNGHGCLNARVPSEEEHSILKTKLKLFLS